MCDFSVASSFASEQAWRATAQVSNFHEFVIEMSILMSKSCDIPTMHNYFGNMFCLFFFLFFFFWETNVFMRPWFLLQHVPLLSSEPQKYFHFAIGLLRWLSEAVCAQFWRVLLSHFVRMNNWKTFNYLAVI